MLCKTCKRQKECNLRLIVGKSVQYCSRYQQKIEKDIDYCLGCQTISDCLIYQTGLDVESCFWRTFNPSKISKYNSNRVSHAQISWLKFLLDDCKTVEEFLKVIE